MALRPARAHESISMWGTLLQVQLDPWNWAVSKISNWESHVCYESRVMILICTMYNGTDM